LDLIGSSSQAKNIMTVLEFGSRLPKARLTGVWIKLNLLCKHKFHTKEDLLGKHVFPIFKIEIAVDGAKYLNTGIYSGMAIVFSRKD
jgi:hypothetical protein